MSKKIFLLSLIAITLLTACVHNNGPVAVDPNAPDEGTNSADTDAPATDDSADTKPADTSDKPASDSGTTVDGDVKVDIEADASADTGTKADTATDANTGTATDTPPDAIHEISVIGNEFKFAPESISVKAGEKVKITFKNEGNFPHNIAIEELALTSAVIGTGETTTLEFTAPAAGTYTIYCSVAGHRDAGMEGDLVSQ